jgi:hypothetical protein
LCWVYTKYGERMAEKKKTETLHCFIYFGRSKGEFGSWFCLWYLHTTSSILRHLSADYLQLSNGREGISERGVKDQHHTPDSFCREEKLDFQYSTSHSLLLPPLNSKSNTQLQPHHNTHMASNLSHYLTTTATTTMLTPATLHTLTTLLTLLFLPYLAVHIHRDYKHFLSLGPGGTPSTPLGYLKIKLLSLLCLRDVHAPMPIPPHFRPQTGYLAPSSLPKRTGTRPLIQGVAPQRQQSQKSDAAVYECLVKGFKELAGDKRNKLREATSCFEKHSSGLFTSVPITRTCGGEICHAHPSDGSMHMSLHPADANLVIENRWGERHPLARGGWCRRFVPKEFVLVYAPRSEEEVEVVMRVVAASVWWVSGMDVNGEDVGERRRSRDVEAVGKAVEGEKGNGYGECWKCGGGVRERLTGDA